MEEIKGRNKFVESLSEESGGSEITTILTTRVREGGGAEPKARKILVALN